MHFACVDPVSPDTGFFEGPSCTAGFGSERHFQKQNFGWGKSVFLTLASFRKTVCVTVHRTAVLIPSQFTAGSTKTRYAYGCSQKHYVVFIEKSLWPCVGAGESTLPCQDAEKWIKATCFKKGLCNGVGNNEFHGLVSLTPTIDVNVYNALKLNVLDACQVTPFSITRTSVLINQEDGAMKIKTGKHTVQSGMYCLRRHGKIAL